MAKHKKPAGPVPKEALAFLKAKRLRPAFSYREVWEEEHNKAFTVAKLMETDLLYDVQTSILDSLEKGIPFEQWRRDIKPTMDKSGWSNYGGVRKEYHRLRVIFDTNVRTARAVGQYERIQKTKAMLPYLLYGLGPSRIHRPVHESWAGLILSADDPFWDQAYPPNGYLCKCTVTQITQRRAQSLGGIGVAPKDISDGVQEGFRYNPGKTVERGRVLDKAQRESNQQLAAAIEEVNKKLRKG